MSNDYKMRVNSLELTREIERLSEIASKAGAGQRPRLLPAERDGMIEVAEQAMRARSMYAMGDDELVHIINSTPERHQFAAMGLARSLATHDGRNSPNPFKDNRLASVYTRQQQYDAFLDRHNPAAGPRWVVQKWNEDRGVFQDVQQTNSAKEANDIFRSGSEYRIHDAKFNDVAAEHIQRSDGTPAPEPVYSVRSGFQRALAEEQERMPKEIIRRQEYLHPDRAAAQERAIAAVEGEAESLKEAYRALPQAQGGRYVAADLAKELFTDFNQSQEARNRYNGPVHNSAAVLSTQLFEDAVRNHVDGKQTRAIFLTGSPGAGKTTSVMHEGRLQDDVRVVFEGQMYNAQAAAQKIDVALAQGLRPEIMVVHPKPETALENTFRRFDHEGRGASTMVMAKIQGNLPDGLAEIHRRYGNRVRLRVVDTSSLGQRLNREGWREISTLRSYGNEEQIKARLDAHLERHRAAGTITDACYRQAASKLPWREQLNDVRRAANHDPDQDRRDNPKLPMEPSQAKRIIEATDEHPTLHSDDLARVHFIARQDSKWSAEYDAKHGTDIALRSRELAATHGQRLAQKLQESDQVQACKQYPELVNTHRIIAAQIATLREQGLPPTSVDAVRKKLIQRHAEDLKVGKAGPTVTMVKEVQRDTKEPSSATPRDIELRR